MAIQLREYIGSNAITSASYTNKKIPIKEYEQDINPIDDNSIMQDIEGLHVGPTGNYTWYMAEGLKSSIKSWTEPYQKPLIMHHNEKDGKIIGRVCAVSYLTESTRSGTPALLFTCNVPDEEGKKQIQDGRLKTTSVGVTATDVRCSICGKQIELDENGCSICGHERGQAYETESGTQTCYWQVYEMEAKELSYVIVPSDPYAHNIRTYKPNTKKDFVLKESLQEREIKMEDNKKDLRKNQTIDETIKDDNKAPASNKELDADKNKSIIEEKDAKIKELEAEIEKLKTKTADAEKKAEKVEDDLKVAMGRIESLKASLRQETELKEAAEEQLKDGKIKLRESLEESFNCYRTALNKPVILTESLKDRSDESLRDSIIDLKEELQGLNNVKNIKPVIDPTLKESKDENTVNAKLDLKESKTEDSVNDLLKSLYK